jgi:Rps23 Pro-64 3,4-dihydroxylase Tpa1-like proline 4-hydroxylase
MKTVLDCKNIQVIDDVLTEEEFKNLHSWINAIPFAWKNAQEEWNKAWSTTDGSILLGQKMFFSPTFSEELSANDSALRPVLDQIYKIVDQFIGIKNIEKVGITPYVWPPGVGLSWHTDSNYIGTFTYYVHNHWGANWSGEFLTVEADEYLEKPDGLRWQVFNNDELEKLILDHGVGYFIQPKPNRLVIGKAGSNGILHKVNRSTLQAKDRLTLQGFLFKHEKI